MTIKVQIAGIEQELSTLSESWIHEQIKRRQRDSLSVCVKVLIKNNNVNIILSSGECEKGRTSGRQTNDEENHLFDLWDKLHLNKPPINSGNLIGFLTRIKSSCR